MDLEILSRPSN